MKLKILLFWISYLIALSAVGAAGLFIKKSASDFKASEGILVVVMAVFVLEAGRRYGSRHSVAAAVITAAAGVIFFFPLDIIGLSAVFVLAAVCAAAYVPVKALNDYNETLKDTDRKLEGRKEYLLRVKNASIKRAKQEDDQTEREVKEILPLYGAIKELSRAIKIGEIAEIIVEIMKKTIKNGFKIELEQVSFALIIKNDAGYKVQSSFGYDEEFLKEGEKALVQSVLKNAAKGSDIVYKQDISTEKQAAAVSIVKSVVYIPFYAENQLKGVLFLSSPKPALFTDKQIESLKILANQIAITLEKVYLYEEVEKMSVTDGLTGLYVHRYFQEKLENEIKRAARYGGNMAIVMCDIDFFKTINDTHGHLAGDQILKSMAMILKNNTTAVDTVARYGGEEFIIIMPDTDKDAAHARAVKIRKAVEAHDFRYKELHIKVTISMGVAVYPGDAITRRTLVEKADKALYKAKEAGRNRVVKAG
ncbi:MAG TPA: GGDEF domain-containing protein [bacterium]|nr:GGDEF domain-containing protein [bacterium]